MSCRDVERWLDDGMPAAGADAARAHVATCAGCARALAAALALDRALAGAPAPAPAGFTDAVMRRVATTDRARARAAWSPAPPEPALAWWVRAAAEPAAVLAFALAALLVWLGPSLSAAAAGAIVGADRALAAAGTWVANLLPVPSAVPARAAGLDPFALVALMALPWVGWLLFRWSEGFARALARRT